MLYARCLLKKNNHNLEEIDLSKINEIYAFNLHDVFAYAKTQVNRVFENYKHIVGDKITADRASD